MEFKKLSAVEVVASVSDAANVLIEEDGVIKRAPKSEVGGVKVTSAAEVGQTIVVKTVDDKGNPTEWECADMNSGDNEYDIVLTVDAKANNTAIMVDNITISQGSMELVRKAVVDGRIPKAKVIFDYNSSVDEYGVYGDITEVDASIYLYGGYIYLSCIGFDSAGPGQLVTHMFCFDETGIINAHRSWYVNLNPTD